MEGQILHSLKSCFAGVEERKELALAAILDPRFKDKFFKEILLVRRNDLCYYC